MMIKSVNKQDVVAGAFFLLLGALGVALIGFPSAATGKSSSAFPQFLAAVLALFGIAIVGRGIRRGSVPWTALPLRAVSATIGSVLLFALLIERAGLIPATIGTTTVAAFGFSGTRWRQMLLFALCLALAAGVLFVELLNQPMKLAPGF